MCVCVVCIDAVSETYAQITPRWRQVAWGRNGRLLSNYSAVAWVCGRPLTGTADSNPADGIDVCILEVLCVVR